MSKEPIYWFVISLAVISIPLLLWAWLLKLIRKRPGSEATPAILLILATISASWYFVALKYSASIGTSYSVRNVATDVNLLGMLACSVLAMLSKGRGHIQLAIASLLLTAVWFFAAIVNAAV
jgi:hypothetical protein